MHALCVCVCVRVHVCVCACVCFQTLLLTLLMKYLGHKHTIMFGLIFEIIQLSCYGFATQTW